MPEMLWIFVVSIASSSVIGGMIVAMRFDEHRFARAGRADHEQIVPARDGDFDRALHVLLAFHVAEIDLVALMRARRMRSDRRGSAPSCVSPRMKLEGLAADSGRRRHRCLPPSRLRARSLPGRRSPAFLRRRASSATGKTPFTGRTAPFSASSPTKLNLSTAEPIQLLRRPRSCRARWADRSSALPS